MKLEARLFVAAIFTVLGLSFIATTAALYYEFGHTLGGADWFAMATFYSHLFIFFPVFGLLALFAFYVPSSAFTDMYWRHVPYGRLRFVVGFVVLAAASVLLSQALTSGKLRSIWEVKPDALAKDEGDPVGCFAGKQSCARVPVLAALADVRARSQDRTGMAQFVRNCERDPLVETPPNDLARRYCFITRTLVDAETCCAAQKRFGEAISAMYEVPGNGSLTARVHNVLLPLKIFFLLVVMVIGLLLAARRHGLSEHYASRIPQIERGVLIGAFSMLFMPVMNLAFLQSSGLLYGTNVDSFYRALSWPLLVAFAAWALLLLFFFFRDTDKDVETVGRIAGVIASALAISNYNTIIDYFARYAGAGATVMTLTVLALIALSAFLAILIQPKRRIPGMGGKPPGAGAAVP
ncbi:MAG: hypothetical protein NW217_07350 [Hyphomicrobiaceae bacterium]|nr:hypothetical protein [Hyphomicrobiaceae bacterium]